jgi:hypothetical protein
MGRVDRIPQPRPSQRCNATAALVERLGIVGDPAAERLVAADRVHVVEQFGAGRVGDDSGHDAPFDQRPGATPVVDRCNQADPQRRGPGREQRTGTLGRLQRPSTARDAVELLALRYLVQAPSIMASTGREIQIGGPDVLSYGVVDRDQLRRVLRPRRAIGAGSRCTR